jgi:hypothetical protein
MSTSANVRIFSSKGVARSRATDGYNKALFEVDEICHTPTMRRFVAPLSMLVLQGSYPQSGGETSRSQHVAQ